MSARARTAGEPYDSTARRRSEHVRGKALAFVAAAILLPVVIASAVLWQMVTTQLESGYEKRLTTGLATYALILNNKYASLREALSQIAADNTLQVTLELDIRPQLAKYLKAQYDVLSLDLLQVADPAAQPLVSLGSHASEPAPEFVCTSAGQPTDTLVRSQDRLFLAQQYPVRKGPQLLGYVCGAIELNGPQFITYLRKTLGGAPLLWWNGTAIPALRLENNSMLSPEGSTTMFELFQDGEHFRGMLEEGALGSGTVVMGILIPITQLEEGLGRVALSVGLVLLLILVIGAVALRYFSLQRQAAEQLRNEKELALVTLSSIGDSVVTTDTNGCITYLNPAAERLCAHGNDTARGKSWNSVFEIVDEGTGERAGDLIEECLTTGQPVRGPNNMVLVRGPKQTAIQYTAAPISDSEHQSKGAVLVVHDVDQERDLQRKLAWKASRDDLTSLLNRTEFSRRVVDALASAKADELQHSLLYLDLDQFKVVNDSCGHKVGDNLLSQISTLLKSQMREIDILARLGGDEFGVLLFGCSPDAALRVAEKLRETVKEHRFSYADKVFEIGVSIGVVNIDGNSGDLDSLMSAVDAACYAAKDEGRNRVHVHEAGEGETNRRLAEMQWVPRIRGALREDRFALYYQPIMPIRNLGDTPGGHGEILLRMLDENGELVPPGAFISVAERYGLMADIDRWVIQTLFTRYRHHYDRDSNVDTDNHPFSINLSGTSLADTGFLDFVTDQIVQHQIPPRLVCFEITETVAISHLDKASALINRLKAEGCRFMLDDFGSGMSSFGYLKHLPVDYLKIDGLFVKDITNDPVDFSMVKAINEIGHTLGLKTIAEYVENAEILEQLRLIGVDFAQGYGIAKPQPLDTLSIQLTAATAQA